MKIEVYRDSAGEWRWRLKAGNGRIMADGGEGYVDRRGAIRAVTSVLRLEYPGPSGRGDTSRIRLGFASRSGGRVTYAQWGILRDGFTDPFYELKVIE